MSGITLAQAQAQLDAYLDASLKVAEGQRVRIGIREVTMADLPSIQQSIAFWDGMVRRLTEREGSRGIRVRGVTPC